MPTLHDMEDEDFVRRFDEMQISMDRLWPGRSRRRLFSQLRGHVLEVGAGTGNNLRYYEKADRVTAVEPNPVMVDFMKERAQSVGYWVEVVQGSADPVPLPANSVDVVVYSLVLCLVPDAAKALGEARRVLRPGGRIAFLEHVAARGPLGLLQRRLEPWHMRNAAGCELRRDTVGTIRDAGFEITALYRHHPFFNPPWVAPVVEGFARLPAGTTG
ncbi:ubiquinone/menaquinone biosynthesis C-methylase UbiE [Actinoalloteichus hoggarensis]|uniref:Ubiquinone/menaquinone biosynthesis C-methyltransferase UbiE n=1 Tax=Actinoalloteichus hoggarensis TaxID=1470176 RepID=A0A221W4J6_9PSEU|nr:class I SAM-dependent methyltransferase [Actinoalloteichus hoggarensis]ASO20694.1 Ubiquinone/menaquinone biosynthesis C-methyltransferase UbiE [Actinoalloteichus hoggarensis]MBB5924453.1 ubiquinone/menaquinone biosynthesis C-methylase UbiE [Actinoalloteichus hoggarensis]